MSGATIEGPGSAKEGRIARSWRLTRASWSVVRHDRALLTLAMIAGLSGAAAIALIFGLSGIVGGGHTSRGHVAVAALILSYPLTFITVFFNVAIAAAAAAAIDGNRLSLGEALAVPMRRVGQVALWALIVAVVGVVLEQLASRLPLVGSIVVRLVGVGWSLASLFAVPILAVEDYSAPDSLRRSAHLVKERWGEGISGNVIVSAWMVIVVVPLVIAFVVLLSATASDSGAQDAVIVLAVVAFIAIVAIGAVVRQTFAVALYRYAKTNSAQGPFHERDLGSPFSTKRRMFG